MFFSCVLVELLIAQSDVPHSFPSLPVLVSPVVLTTHADLGACARACVGQSYSGSEDRPTRVGVAVS